MALSHNINGGHFTLQGLLACFGLYQDHYLIKAFEVFCHDITNISEKNYASLQIFYNNTI
jgi:hypothetical protein